MNKDNFYDLYKEKIQHIKEQLAFNETSDDEILKEIMENWEKVKKSLNIGINNYSVNTVYNIRNKIMSYSGINRQHLSEIIKKGDAIYNDIKSNANTMETKVKYSLMKKLKHITTSLSNISKLKM